MTDLNIKDIDDSDFKKFKKKLEANGVSVSFIIRKFIKDF